MNALTTETTPSILDAQTTMQSAEDKEDIVMYPSLKEPDFTVFAVASVYLICFVIGICGNSSTLTVIFGIGSPPVRRKSSGNNGSKSTNDSFRIYVAALCIVDTLVLLSLPWAIVDSLIGFWIFGTAACKVHHLFGSVGRIMSTLLITAMSIDRYLIVAYPQTFSRRSTRTTSIIVACLFGIATLVLLPLLIFARAKSFMVFHRNNTGGGSVTIHVYKCVDGMPTYLLFWFTGSTFVVGYVIPIFVITMFNIGLLVKIRKHQRKISVRSMIPMKRVTAYIAAIAIFYFACWTPYWIGVVYVSYVDLFESRELRELTNASENTMLVLYCAHIFPYINSAVNWFLYGRLASNLARHRPPPSVQATNSRNCALGSEMSPTARSHARGGGRAFPLPPSAADTQRLLANNDLLTLPRNEDRRATINATSSASSIPLHELQSMHSNV